MEKVFHHHPMRAPVELTGIDICGVAASVRPSAGDNDEDQSHTEGRFICGCPPTGRLPGAGLDLAIINLPVTVPVPLPEVHPY
jgi:hypothetical protein